MSRRILLTELLKETMHEHKKYSWDVKLLPGKFLLIVSHKPLKTKLPVAMIIH